MLIIFLFKQIIFYPILYSYYTKVDIIFTMSLEPGSGSGSGFCTNGIGGFSSSCIGRKYVFSVSVSLGL